MHTCLLKLFLWLFPWARYAPCYTVTCFVKIPVATHWSTRSRCLRAAHEEAQLLASVMQSSGHSNLLARMTWPAEASALERTRDGLTTALYSGGMPCLNSSSYCAGIAERSERHSSVIFFNQALEKPLNPSAQPAMIDFQSVGSGVYGIALAPEARVNNSSEVGSTAVQIGLDSGKCAPGRVPVLVKEEAVRDGDVVSWQVDGVQWHARCVQPVTLALNEPTMVCLHVPAWHSCHSCVQLLSSALAKDGALPLLSLYLHLIYFLEHVKHCGALPQDMVYRECTTSADIPWALSAGIYPLWRGGGNVLPI
jgi:hypothetical protein